MSERSFYLAGEGEAVFASHHAPASDATGRGVLLLPPFGWEETATHRARRDWALHLARRGHDALRIDLPGTGDSAGDLADPRRWESWGAAARRAASWLRREAGVTRVTAVGVGSGGYLAFGLLAEARAEEAVLWGTPVTGKRFLRELAAFGALEASRIAEAGGPPSPERTQGIEAGGFVLPPELEAAIAGIDLADASLPPSARLLLVGRDGAGSSQRLVEALRGRGVDVATDDGHGYAAMVVQPDRAVAPHGVFDAVAAWLDAAPAPSPSLSEPSRGLASPELLAGATRERPIEVALPSVRLRGVLAEPLNVERGLPTLLFLNAGAIRRTGPNRLWVSWARRWAARGVPSVRLDLEGIGDADGDDARYRDVARFHDEELVKQVHAAVSALVELGLPARFVAVGLCSGGYWAYQAALADERVAAAVMVNTRVLQWHEHLEQARDLRRTRLLVRPVTWKRLLRGDVPLRRWKGFAAWVAARTLGRLGARRGASAPSILEWQARQAAAGFTSLRDAGRRAHFVFCDGEPLRDELTEAGLLTHPERWPNVSCRFIPGREHTLKPVWMQRFATTAFDDVVAAEVALAESTA
ncbi:MAG TPA: hypothetical protein VFI04_04145 [Gaiellaceae bacterium]|nr:hypothetical protein [Gaiellaceae bacterium]